MTRHKFLSYINRSACKKILRKNFNFRKFLPVCQMLISHNICKNKNSYLLLELSKRKIILTSPQNKFNLYYFDKKNYNEIREKLQQCIYPHFNKKELKSHIKYISKIENTRLKLVGKLIKKIEIKKYDEKNIDYIKGIFPKPFC